MSEQEIEIKNMLVMVEQELCFGGNWEAAKATIVRIKTKLEKGLHPEQPDMREALRTILSKTCLAGDEPEIEEQILALRPKVLDEEEIESLLKELRRNSGGKILRTMDIYRAISRAMVEGNKGG